MIEWCIRCRVRGRVQGVAFRASARSQARALGVVGHARNLPDGDVEVVAAGSARAVEAMRAWLAEGPPQARVDAVECETISDTPPPGFKVR